ncbi:PAS domain-containing protein [Streptomyces chiangmaiensis]|uniref:PAS domain S-box protein n=1 Tax=Streptomyces chiangmaiensis TaxID=766497 RepID=A0ABU7FIJ2_9ACTN|nr:PAS domain S-box protein [Streptomyces chiangmaiensis]MED7823947.1 PAS domain S-box protein [Streptomyces chiangmaiensis]
MDGNNAAGNAASSGRAGHGAGRIGEPEAWLAQAILRESSEAIVVADPEGIIQVWNGGAERMFGHPAAEAVGQSLDLIIPEKLRGRHGKGYRNTMATGQTRYGDTLLGVPATHRDGHRLSIEFTVALLRDATGRIAGISAIMREVTERRNTEKELRTRLAQLERRLSQTSPA